MENISNLRAAAGVRDDVDVRASRYVNGVYTQMSMGVLVTAFVAYLLLATGTLQSMLEAGGRGMMWGVIILQFGTLMAFRPLSQRLSPAGIKAMFFFYAAITGWTLGVAAMVFTMASLMNVFAIAALSFGGLAAFGHVTKKNLTGIGTFCMQALWMTFFFGLFYAAAQYIPAVSTYLPSMNITLGLLGIVVFSGITAYEGQKVREMAYSLARSDADGAAITRYTSFGALNMYLNFINLFFSLLRLMGRRR